MFEEFDPYEKWLGIPPQEQPPNHYRLLGICPFEEDRDKIRAAALRQTASLRRIDSEEHAKRMEQLLNEIQQAKICLMNPELKSEYDATLWQKLSAGEFETVAPDVFSLSGEMVRLAPSSSAKYTTANMRMPVRSLVGLTLAVLFVAGWSIWSARASKEPPNATTTRQIEDEPSSEPAEGQPLLEEVQESPPPAIASGKPDRGMKEGKASVKPAIAPHDSPVNQIAPEKPPTIPKSVQQAD